MLESKAAATLGRAKRLTLRLLSQAKQRASGPEPVTASELLASMQPYMSRLGNEYSIRTHGNNCVTVGHSVGELRYAFDLRIKVTRVELSVVGRDSTSKRILRGLFVNHYPMILENGERHSVTDYPRLEVKELTGKAFNEIQKISAHLERQPNETTADAVPRGPVAVTYWWDNKSNFGDTIGPWLVNKFTGLETTNSKWYSDPAPSLYSVGSVLGHLDRPGHHVWGSGLIGPLGTAKAQRLSAFRPSAIHAVRGSKTRDELVSKLGWEVPEVYGDPALLLPRFFTPPVSTATKGKVGIVPHYAHRPAFKAMQEDRHVHIISVGNGLERVVTQIAGAKSIISTSLHGVVLAQAYGIPWVWLRITDEALPNDGFKFEDFFTVLHRSSVSEVALTKAQIPHQNFSELAQLASLPDMTFDLDVLQNAFPTHGSWLVK